MDAHDLFFPLAYRWFISRELTNWEPWSFIDDESSVNVPPDWSKGDWATRPFKLETDADFDVYLFARRQDCDDYAFFVVRDGRIEDKVISIHLSFAKRFELKSPLRYQQDYPSFITWLRKVVLPDLEDWMTEEALLDE